KRIQMVDRFKSSSESVPGSSISGIDSKKPFVADSATKDIETDSKRAQSMTDRLKSKSKADGSRTNPVETDDSKSKLSSKWNKKKKPSDCFKSKSKLDVKKSQSALPGVGGAGSKSPDHVVREKSWGVGFKAGSKIS